MVVAGRSEGRTAKAIAADLDVSPALVDTIYARSKDRLRHLLAASQRGLAFIPLTVPAAVRRRIRRWVQSLSSGARSADTVNAGQLAALLAAAAIVATGVGVVSRGGLAPARAAAGRHVLGADNATSRGAMPATRAEGRSVREPAARPPGFVVARSEAVPYQPRHCLVVGDCGAAAHPDPNGHHITIDLGALGTLTVNPYGPFQNLPRTWPDWQTAVLGDPNGVACDARLIPTGSTCHGQDAAALVAQLAEFYRQGLVGDICTAYAQRGIDVPVACRPIPSTQADALPPERTPAVSPVPAPGVPR